MRSQKFLWSIRHLQIGAGGVGTTTAEAGTGTGLAGGLGMVGGAVGAAGPTGILRAIGGGGGLQAWDTSCWAAGGAIVHGGGRDPGA